MSLNLEIHITSRALSTLVYLILSLPAGVDARSLEQDSWLYTQMPPIDAEAMSIGGELSAPVRAPASEEDVSDFDEFSDFADEFGEEFGGDSEAEVYDPLEGYNRWMFGVNDWMFDNVLIPMIKGYNFVLPQGVRVSLGKFFHNLLYPLRFVNNLLQFKFKGAMVETGRFIVNTTFGVGGLFDPADHYLGWLPYEEDFGQTLAYWGVGGGPPLVLPFLGMSNLRDTVGLYPVYLVHPVYHVAGSEWYLAEQSLEFFNFASLHYKEYLSLRNDALDPYTYFRDAYQQNRESRIRE